MDAFRDFLATAIGELHEYRVVLVDALPVTEAGKTDRSALLKLVPESDT